MWTVPWTSRPLLSRGCHILPAAVSQHNQLLLPTLLILLLSLVPLVCGISIGKRIITIMKFITKFLSKPDGCFLGSVDIKTKVPVQYSTYRVSHPLVPLDSVMFSFGSCVSWAVGSCRTSPPACHNFVKAFDKIYGMSGWETRYKIDE